jgi:hypothetical protein
VTIADPDGNPVTLRVEAEELDAVLPPAERVSADGTVTLVSVGDLEGWAG